MFITGQGLDWRAVRLDDLGEYVAWLALPPGGRDGGVAVLPSVQAHVSATTVSRKLAALAAFYAFQARRGVDVAGLLTSWQAGGGRGGWKPFLHHISKGKPQARRVIALKAPVKLPRVVTARGDPGDPRRVRASAGPAAVCPAVGLRPASRLVRLAMPPPGQIPGQPLQAASRSSMKITN